MRLLKRAVDGDFELTEDLVDDIPPYAILSHTWSDAVDEVTYDDFVKGQHKIKKGYRKIQFCGDQAFEDGLAYCWVDTVYSCCIDKSNHVELSEAITSMFRWYRNAVKCYVYLTDVSAKNGTSQIKNLGQLEIPFRRSRWFTRGWTLQELVAPASVQFFSADGLFLGDKKTLESVIHDITQIPVAALRGQSLSTFTVDERLRWTNGRQTKRVEDKAYCLLGIFDLSMSLRYGEGEKAISRLEAKVKSLPSVNTGFVSASEETPAAFEDDKLISWLAPGRSDEMHTLISASRHPDTGLSFTSGPLSSWLRSEQHDQLMWITGKSGSGKTHLFSHAVDRVQAFASAKPGTAIAYHYCSFSELESQALLNILGSFVLQLAAWQPSILDDMRTAFKRDQVRKRDKTLDSKALEQALVKYIKSINMTILMLDALNEGCDNLETVQCLIRLLQKSPNLRILVTSTTRATSIWSGNWPQRIDIQLDPDNDIRAYIDAHLSKNGSLGHLSPECRRVIRSTLLERADQTFRWVALQIANLCKQRTGKAVLRALEAMPNGLNNTYTSMLRMIPESDKSIAREALRWLSFTLRPLTLLELSEAAVLDDTDTTINGDVRLRQPEVILEICNGFVEHNVDTEEVKLVHSSVKNYFLSERDDGDDYFSFSASEGDQVILRKCLTYLMFDDFKSGVTLSRSETNAYKQAFPLLDYAVYYWGLHASSATGSEWSLAQKFFATRTHPRGGNFGAWVSYLIPGCHPKIAMNTHPLYFAASFGIVPIVQALLRDATSISVDINHPGGRHGSTALQVACFRGKKEVAQLLVDSGADFWAQDRGSGQPAWFWAWSNGWHDLVQCMVQLRPKIAEEVERLHPEEVPWAKNVQMSFGVSLPNE